MTEKKRAPELRFKGFDGEWERRKLGDVAEFNPNTNLPDVFRYVDLESVVGTEMIYSRQEMKDAAPSRAQRLAKKGDLFYQTVRPYQKNNYLFELDNEDYVFSTGYAQMRPHNSGYFLMSLVQNELFVKTVLDRCTGTSYPAISPNELSEIEMFFPKEINEENKIGSYFKHLDQLITHRQRKRDKLKVLKQAMLGKLFPREGADVPELRFAGFAGKWERRKYSELFKNLPNNSLPRAELNYESGLARNIHYGDVLIKFGEVLDVKNEKLPFITDDAIVEKMRASKLQNGDIVIADAAEDETVGKCTELSNVKDEVVVSGLHTIPVRPMQQFSSGYLGYFMNSHAYHNQLLRLMQGTKVLSLSKTALQDTTIQYPIDEDEQSKIGSYFKQLDQLITLQQRELAKLKNIKQALLDKMFV